MKPRFNPAAAMHWFAGCFKSQDVPPGIHDVGRCVMTLVAPDGATVQRDEGPKGDGFKDPKEPALSLPPLLLFLERNQIKLTQAQWKELCRDATALQIKPKEHTPPEAIAALKELQDEMPEDARPRDKTSAERVGVSMVQHRIERATIAEFDRLKKELEVNTKRMVRRVPAAVS